MRLFVSLDMKEHAALHSQVHGPRQRTRMPPALYSDNTAPLTDHAMTLPIQCQQRQQGLRNIGTVGASLAVI